MKIVELESERLGYRVMSAIRKWQLRFASRAARGVATGSPLYYGQLIVSEVRYRRLAVPARSSEREEKTNQPNAKSIGLFMRLERQAGCAEASPFASKQFFRGKFNVVGICEYDLCASPWSGSTIQGFAEVFLSRAQLDPNSSPGNGLVPTCTAVSALKGFDDPFS
jgi:hypothetical protein